MNSPGPWGSPVGILEEHGSCSCQFHQNRLSKLPLSCKSGPFLVPELFSMSSQQKCFQGLSDFGSQSSQAKISAEFCYWCRSAVLGGEFSLPSGSSSLSSQGNPSLEPPTPNPVTSADICHHLRAGQGSLNFRQGWHWVGAGRNSLVSSRAGTEFGSCKLQVLPGSRRK